MVQRNAAEFNLTESLLRSVQFYYTPILVCLGSLGNCLSLVVFLGTERCQYSSSVYLGALAISDTGFLMSLFVAWLNMLEVSLFNRPGFCQFFIYLTTLCSFVTVWLVAAFTIERFIAVQYPLYRQSLCTVARAKSAVARLTALAMILCSPVLWLSAPRVQYHDEGNVTECGHIAEGLESWATAYNVFDTVVTFAIPSTVILILNVLIVRAHYRHIEIRKSLTNELRTVKDVQSLRSNAAQANTTKILLVVSSVFLCLYLPAYVLRMYAFLYFQEKQVPVPRSMELAQQVCNLLFNTNFGINFVLYCITRQNFRKEVRYIFLKRFRGRNVATMQVSNRGTQSSRCKLNLFMLSVKNRTTEQCADGHATEFAEPCEEFHELKVTTE